MLLMEEDDIVELRELSDQVKHISDVMFGGEEDPGLLVGEARETLMMFAFKAAKWVPVLLDERNDMVNRIVDETNKLKELMIELYKED